MSHTSQFPGGGFVTPKPLVPSVTFYSPSQCLCHPSGDLTQKSPCLSIVELYPLGQRFSFKSKDECSSMSLLSKSSFQRNMECDVDESCACLSPRRQIKEKIIRKQNKAKLQVAKKRALQSRIWQIWNEGKGRLYMLRGPNRKCSNACGPKDMKNQALA